MHLLASGQSIYTVTLVHRMMRVLFQLDAANRSNLVHLRASGLEYLCCYACASNDAYVPTRSNVMHLRTSNGCALKVKYFEISTMHRTELFV